MPDKKKVVSKKPKTPKASPKSKNDEWVIDKLAEITEILQEHQKLLERIKIRMGL
jgi:hypothetical protein